MTNMYTYLDWRGDLTFAQSGFNDVDNLILSWLSYVDFSGIVPEGAEGVSIAWASEQFFQTHTPIQKVDIATFCNASVMSTQLLEKLAPTVRFGGLKLINHVSRFDKERGEQFAALTVRIDDGLSYIAFRGTDGTLTGWKEDFCMCFMPSVPAQLDALAYLEAQARMEGRTLLVGGHSKGGNLAIYAAVNASEPVRESIQTIYNNDGPGFGEDLLASDAYQQMSGRIKTILPYSSVIGMLMERKEAYTVVKSAQIGLLQHNALNWEVRGAGFVEMPTRSASSVFFDNAIKQWLSTIDAAQRRIFVDTLFAALEQTGANTFDEFSQEKLKKARILIRSLSHLDPETRSMLIRVLGKLAAASAYTVRALLQAHGVKWRQHALDDLTQPEKDRQ